MKATKKKARAMGDRLDWIPLKDVKPVNLSSVNIKEKIVVIDSKMTVGKVIVP